MSKGKAHIDVFARIRPTKKASPNVDIDYADHAIAVHLPKHEQGLINNQKENFSFAFTRVLDQTITQDSVFETVAQPVVDSVLQGYNGTVFAYGQTGSGKTLTYLLPMLSKLEDRAAIQAIIVVPTRELGLQVATIAKRLASRKFMIMSLLQGSQLRRQRAWAWAETPQVVIGTPPEILDMVQYGVQIADFWASIISN